MKVKESPCARCRKVAEPEKCDTKECALWRHWFTESWDQLRKELFPKEDPAPRIDPCEGCLIPKAFCAEPCRIREEWEEAQ